LLILYEDIQTTGPAQRRKQIAFDEAVGWGVDIPVPNIKLLGHNI